MNYHELHELTGELGESKEFEMNPMNHDELDELKVDDWHWLNRLKLGDWRYKGPVLDYTTEWTYPSTGWPRFNRGVVRAA